MLNSGIYSPKEIAGLGAWYDAFDLSTLTLSPFNQVTGWADKSGNGFNLAQATTARQPTYTTSGINGRPGVLFAFQSGSTNQGCQLLSAANSLSSSVPGITAFAVLITSDKSSVSGSGSIFLTSSVGATYEMRLAYAAAVTPGDYYADGRRLAAGTVAIAQAGTASNNVAILQTGVFDYTNALLNVYAGGALMATANPMDTAGSTAATNSPLVLGSSGALQLFPLLGSIGEVIIYKRALTQTEQRRVEWYLARKWNINVV